MKPTQEEILSALNEMIQSKTELKSEKVELGLVDDVEKFTGYLKVTDSDLIQEMNALNSFLDRADSAERQALYQKQRLFEQKRDKGYLEEAIKEASSALKELGLTTKDVPAIQEAEKQLTQSTETIKKAAKAMENLSKLLKF